MGLFSKKPRPVKLQQLEELEAMFTSGQPVLLDLYQVGCSACQVMDGIVNELAREYGESAHIVKVDVGRVPGAIQAFKIRSTPTFILMGPAPVKKSKKRGQTAAKERRITSRWRTSGLVRKHQLQRVLESNGAVRAEP
ncbi:MAG: thioredoxin family protein [Acidimicrobiia bacterium]|jgi:thioredoxin 1